jgi:hypothetical protein
MTGLEVPMWMALLICAGLITLLSIYRGPRMRG